MLNKFKILTAALIFTTLISCSKNDKKDDIVTFKATLSGASEVPGNTSTASGTSTLTYNKGNKKFTVVTSYTGLTPTGGHIHKAAAGTNGPILFIFTSLPSPITFEGSMTETQYNALSKDSMYVNLHTSTFTSGEIRGQLIKQ